MSVIISAKEMMQVDAALDLSHTQNIGRMIKAHFPYSQFIVVSLKEGMFSNANVLFRTKFVDGVSAVTRTATQAAYAPAQLLLQVWQADTKSVAIPDALHRFSADTALKS